MADSLLHAATPDRGQVARSGCHRLGQNPIAYRISKCILFGSTSFSSSRIKHIAMDPLTAAHHRNASRSSRPRSSTRGPLDALDDPLSASTLPTSPTKDKSMASNTFTGASFHELDPLAPDDLPETLGKDLSFLLRHNVFHTLSHLDIPPPLRSEFLILNPGEPLSSSLAILEKLLSEGRFLVAAHFSASILTSSLISSTDIRLIFSLFYTRLACLELSGNTVFASQESKALEDLSSAFYYIDVGSARADNDNDLEHEHANEHEPRHIVPWPLRVLAVRLQSIGFGDSRRGIGGLYEIGIEVRREIMRKGISETERDVWKQRLADLGISSINALIEMGDFDAARRSLGNLRVPGPEAELTKLRKALLLLRVGDLDAASQVFGDANETKEAALLKPLISMSDGRYSDAVAEWRALGDDRTRTDGALVAQNLAVCLLYTGQLDEVFTTGVLVWPTQLILSLQARQLLEAQVSTNHSFGSLVFNLSTIYELCSDNAGYLKGQLAETIAKQPVTGQTNLDRPNSDLKL
ncbi:unnamed protein product [Penicillium salamii]|uniref:Tetratricopeptide-like helical n=1 Tax=Penicillium salamii TaxID=1612424 RepID=A0A9W4NU22_9EURO|nr:unnamed protein product [Penicillium salamii]CAG8360933.1 unnamed protein product [Penicillium salamii]CAG8420771.1 unnamed protein product [Penicillium salamii]CAG8424141.1 unnamed protein product [Penicillium salamii]